jgi:hypothetical protein
MSDGLGTLKWAETNTSDASLKRTRITEWQMPGRIPLALSPISITTPSSGGGGGGGGGDGGCLKLGMYVKEETRGIIHCEDVKSGNRLWGENGYLKVITVRRMPHESWARCHFDNYAVVDTTARHPYSLIDGSMVRASNLTSSDALRAPEGMVHLTEVQVYEEAAEKISIILEAPHTFYASSDGQHWVLTHNMMAST